jgi:[CysO sulfur-carrier protein]-S-L-cysteine hydrolase
MGEQMAPNQFCVVDFSVDEASGNAVHFTRNPKHHIGALERFFDRTGADYRRFNYLGEWHSHPGFAVSPSREDLLSMQDIVDGHDQFPFAALLIVRLRWCVLLDAAGYMFTPQTSPLPVSVTI